MISAILTRYGFGWIIGPVGKALGLALVALVAIHLIRQDAISDCESDQLRAQLVEKEAQLRAQEQIIAASRERADVAEAKIAELGELTDEIIRDTAGLCPIDDELRERLREIQ